MRSPCHKRIPPLLTIHTHTQTANCEPLMDITKSYGLDRIWINAEVAERLGIADGDEVTVDFDTGVITDVTKGTTYQAEPFPPFIKDMIARGGLMASLKAKEAAK